MSKISLLRPLAIALSAASLLAIQPSFAQQPPAARVRGIIDSVTGDTMTVKANDGSMKSVELKSDTGISVSNRSTVDDIKPNSFSAIVGQVQDDGPQKAVSIVIFPEDARGRGEGSRGYDMGPKSSMTNATVAPDVVKSTDGQVITVTYKGGEKKFIITKDTQVSVPLPGTKADLKPGAAVLVTANANGDKLDATRIAVGKDGFVPM
jgi:hypothetical protein